MQGSNSVNLSMCFLKGVYKLMPMVALEEGLNEGVALTVDG